MKASTIITLIISALCFQNASAFLDMAIPVAAPSIIAPEAVFGDAFASFADSPLASSTMGIANAFALPAKSPFMPSPDFESQVLGDMAMALNFSEIFRPSKKAMRMISLGGRLLGLMADYVPDHSIHTEELLIQLFFIGSAVKEILEDEFQFEF